MWRPSIDESHTIDTHILDDVTLDFWVKPEPGDGNEFLAAGIDPPWEQAKIVPGDSLASVTNEDYLLLQVKFAKQIPSFTDVEVVDAWTGVITATPDWHQLVGPPQRSRPSTTHVTPVGTAPKNHPASPKLSPTHFSATTTTFNSTHIAQPDSRTDSSIRTTESAPRITQR